MTQIIGFHSVAQGQGKRTFSLSFAELLAKNNYNTLFIELDVFNPSLYLGHNIAHELKNLTEYVRSALNNDAFQVERFAIKKSELIADKEGRKLFSNLPDKLSYLALQKDFQIDKFPVIVDSTDSEAEERAHKFIQKFINALKNSDYDYVVISLPTEINHIFGYEIVKEVDKLINVVTVTAARFDENTKVMQFLKKTIPSFENKLFTLINMASDRIDDSKYKEFVGIIGENNHYISKFDLDRKEYELAYAFGSPAITNDVELMALKMKIAITPTPKKKKLFGVVGG